jgi:hypothetical protein
MGQPHPREPNSSNEQRAEMQLLDVALHATPRFRVA